MKKTLYTMLIAGVLLAGCKKNEVCGHVTKTWQTGRSGDEFKAAIVTDTDHRTEIIELSEYQWANAVAGTYACGPRATIR